MASRKTIPAKEPRKKQKAETQPKFPYSTKPSSLRRLLKDIPNKPKPPKFDKTLLRSRGFADANDYSMIRVLKAIGLLSPNNEPTELYSQYMHLDGGPAALAVPIKHTYEPLFNASLTPFKESNEKLQNLFNIHSGGGERALDQQIQTFKALCEYTSFENSSQVPQQSPPAAVIPGTVPGALSTPGSAAPTIHINVHIHLPENKSRRDYEAIIEEIGRCIFGREESSKSDE